MKTRCPAAWYFEIDLCPLRFHARVNFGRPYEKALIARCGFALRLARLRYRSVAH